jgi:signal peptidase I
MNDDGTKNDLKVTGNEIRLNGEIVKNYTLNKIITG